MKTLRILIQLSAVLLLQACAFPTSSPQISSRDASLDVPGSITPPNIILRGRIVLGTKTSSFTPCGSQHQYLLILPPALQQKTASLAKTPYQEIYGEVIGYLTIPSQTGFNADFQARLMATQLNYVASDPLKSCSLVSLNTQASGNNPAWSVQLAENAMIAALPTMAKQQWKLTSINAQRDQRNYQTNQGDLSLTPALCQLNQHSIFGWRAVFDIKNTNKTGATRQRYHGCARLGNKDPSSSWIATYYATSTRNTDFSVTLQLDPDHHATTRYQYEDDSMPIIETGFWQALNGHQVQVIMTQHQQQYLLSQRIFTREGNTLHAKKELVGTRVYGIANGGLTLYKQSALQQSSQPSDKVQP